jgi:hypothetical protein
MASLTMAGGLVRPGLAPCHMLRDPTRQRFETTTKLVPPIKVRGVCLAQVRIGCSLGPRDPLGSLHVSFSQVCTPAHGTTFPWRLVL